MREYFAFYKGKKITVKAETTYDAQVVASKLMKAKKRYDVTIILASGFDTYITGF